MLNEKKIRYMTKAASYEQGAEKKNFEIAEYFRTDYISVQMIKAAAAYTVSFGLLGCLWAGGMLEELLLQLSRPEYMGNLLKIAAVLYAAGLVLYETAIYFYFSLKYKKAKEYMARYDKQLKRLHEFYEAQDAAEASAAAAEKTDEKGT